jgi:hypothetical protein
MQPIPTPQVLDPDRILDNDRGDFTADHKARAQLLEDALHETCAYSQQLWRDLDAMRGYLLNCLPPDPRSPGPHLTASASPTGPDDDTGWDNWITAYATVTSVLCGPHGDSGFGLSEGRREATVRRTGPALRIHADHPDLGAPDHHGAATPAATTPEPPAAASVPRLRTGRTAAMAVLVFLALRGLRPRRRGLP